jgi:hypothetical protein
MVSLHQSEARLPDKLHQILEKSAGEIYNYPMKYRNGFLMVLLLFCLTALGAQTIAFTGTENRTDRSGFDYTGAVIEGVLLYDLSTVPGVSLVERKRLEEVVSEQRLSLSGLTAEAGEEVGKLLSADYLVSVQYAVLDGESSVTVSLTDTASGAVRLFSSRCTTENDIHALAERTAKAITGRDFRFVNPAERRDLLTLRDTTPGSISLYRNLLHAEVLLDGVFIGYTDGRLHTPLALPDIDPGSYQLQISLGRDFGMISLPEVTFSDWKQEVVVRPGRTSIVRAIISHFNEQIYYLSRLVRKEYSLTTENPDLSVSENADFTDREGKELSIEARLQGRRAGSGSSAELNLLYNDKEQLFRVDSASPEIEREIGKVTVTLTLDDSRPDETRISLQIWRNDLYQGMHRD